MTADCPDCMGGKRRLIRFLVRALNACPGPINLRAGS